MSNYRHEFGKRFRAYREAAGLTQKEVAEKLGYASHVAIFKIETGRQDVSIEKIPAMCRVLNCNALDLLGLHSDNSAPNPEGANIMAEIDKLPASKRNELVKTMEILVKGIKEDQ